MAYVSFEAPGGASFGFFHRIAVAFAALVAADRRVGYAEPFGL